jgi:hypothetical protein
MKIILSDTKAKNVFVLSNKIFKEISLKTKKRSIDDRRFLEKSKIIVF